MKRFSRFYVLLMIAALMFPASSAFVQQAAAQSTAPEVRIWTYDANGNSFTSACYVLVGFSNEGCDVNGDGAITFAEVPYGSYTVTQTRDLGSGRSVSDFTITVGAGSSDFTAYVSGSGSGSSSASGSIDITVMVGGDRYSIYDDGICLSLLGYSEVGCDENGDGGVTFADIPYGTYTVRYEGGMPDGWSLPDQQITVTSGQSTYWVYFRESTAPSSSGDLAVMSFLGDRSFYDACYELVGYSNIGCDENRDGFVEFADVPFGSYVVRQTANISPLIVYDFTINFSYDNQVVFAQVYDTRPAAPAPDSINVSIITRDPDTGKVVTGACYQLVGYSNIGCDENGDGQVDFADIPDGAYTVRQTTTPAGYPTMNDVEIDVDGEIARDYGLNRLGIPLIQRQTQSVSGSNTFAIVFYDSTSGGPVINGSCAQLRDASNVGCDDDLIDGQVDFLDVVPENVNVDIGNLAACPYGEAPEPSGGYRWININDDISVIYVGLSVQGTCTGS